MGGELLQGTEAGAARRGRGGVQFRMPRRPALLAAGPPLVMAGKGKKQPQQKERRKKMAVARLGGGGGGGGRRRLLGAMIRRLRMRWVAAAYRRALRRLSAFYAKALEDLLEGAAAISTLRAEAAAGADYCSFGAAFAPVVSVPGRR